MLPVLNNCAMFYCKSVLPMLNNCAKFFVVVPVIYLSLTGSRTEPEPEPRTGKNRFFW